ncbi:hypothetical protein KA005_58300 [bacterium]|nr:hypothetical protein [bacterium]
MGEERAGTRNIFVYPEKQTPVDRLTARVVSAVCPYLNEEINDDTFDDLSLELKAIGRRFVKEME